MHTHFSLPLPQKLVRKALRQVRACHGGVLRFQTINGSLWVHHDSPLPAEGWWPSKYGPGAGNHCAQYMSQNPLACGCQDGRDA